MKLLVGIPMMGPVQPSVVVSLMRLATEARRYGEVFLSYTEGMVPHDKGREAIFQDASQADVDYVLSVDSDMLFPSDTFGQLYDALIEHQAQVASGQYLRRGYPYTSVWSCHNGGKWGQVTALEGVHEIGMTGLGCVLLDFRWLCDNLDPPFCTYERRYDRPDVLDDESLFEKVREAGGKMIGVASVQCGHQLSPEYVTPENADEFRKRGLNNSTLLQE